MKNIRTIVWSILGTFSLIVLVLIFIPLNATQQDTLKDFIEWNSFFPFILSSNLSCWETKTTQLSEEEIRNYLLNHADSMMEETIQSLYKNIDYSKLIGVKLTTRVYNHSWWKGSMVSVTPFIYRSDYYPYILYTSETFPIDIHPLKSTDFSNTIITKVPLDSRVPLSFESLKDMRIIVTWNNEEKSMICNTGK